MNEKELHCRKMTESDKMKSLTLRSEKLSLSNIGSRVEFSKHAIMSRFLKAYRAAGSIEKNHLHLEVFEKLTGSASNCAVY